MRVVEYGQPAGEPLSGVVVTAGMFDGVHVGHQQIVAEVVRRAAQRDGTSAVLTFDQHPSEVVAPHQRVELLTTTEKKLDLISELGVDVAFLMDFTAELASMSAETFVEEIVVKWCGTSEIVLGHDYRFGAGRRGDETMMCRMGDEHGFTVSRFEPVRLDAVRVSSSLVRECVVAGRLGDAWRYLGRPYTLTGTVMHGGGVGRELGFPTANIRPHHRVIPPDGVYAAEVVLDDGTVRPAAVNIGLRPTVESGDDEVARSVEVYILDFEGDIYGRRIGVAFWQYLRPERKYETLESLQAAIAADVGHVREVLAAAVPYEARQPEARRHLQKTQEVNKKNA